MNDPRQPLSPVARAILGTVALVSASVSKQAREEGDRQTEAAFGMQALAIKAALEQDAAHRAECN